MEPTHDELELKFSELRVKALKNIGLRKGFIFYCYYSGHGILENTTKIVLSKGGYFEIEKQLQDTFKSKVNGVYVIGVLDCCRNLNNVKEKFVKGTPEIKVEDSPNLVICYRAAAYEEALANNEFSKQMEKLLKEKEEKGKVSFIEALLYSKVRT